MKIVIAIIIFSVIILFHELGHFLLAKANKVRVNEFCLGMGPTLIGFTKGETKYSLKLLPFGGACMMEGEDESSADEGAFNNKSVWARISVVAAGPIFNFIMAFICSLIFIACAGVDHPVLESVEKGYPAQEAGLQKGDVITKLDRMKIHFSSEVSSYLTFHAGEAVDVTVERDGKEHQVTLKPKYDKENQRYRIGILYRVQREKVGPLSSISYAAYEVKYWIWTTLESLKMLVHGSVSVNDLSGPVGIVNNIGQSYEASSSVSALNVFLSMMNWTILLSANLGVMNLLPLPALDGGRLVFLIIEAIRRKRIDPNKEGMVHFIGIMALMALMVIIMFNDIRKIFV